MLLDAGQLLLGELEVLEGGGPEDVVELTIELAREMLKAAGKEDIDPADALADGRAMDVWRAMISAQGGDPDAELPTAKETHDVLAPADYFGSFLAEIAYFRPSTGTWHIVKNSLGSGTSTLTVRWGADGDIPVPADYNGDGKADPAVFRPSEGVGISIISPTVLTAFINGA